METAYNRTILDLYKKLHKTFAEKHTLYICKAILINRMNFSIATKNKLKEHFLTQFPTESQYPEFYNNPLFNKRNDDSDGWFIYDRTNGNGFSNFVVSEAFELRLKLLEAIIENLEKNPELNLVL